MMLPLAGTGVGKVTASSAAGLSSAGQFNAVSQLAPLVPFHTCGVPPAASHAVALVMNVPSVASSQPVNRLSPVPSSAGEESPSAATRPAPYFADASIAVALLVVCHTAARTVGLAAVLSV